MSKELKCKWTFRQYVPGDDKLQGANDPIIQKFKENFFNSLVRESIQNSMDAKAEGQDHIEVSFSLGSLEKNDYPELFNLSTHINACLETHKQNDRAREIYTPMASFLDTDRIDVLTVSDSLTKGMPYIPDNLYNNPFSAFVNSDGQSVKNKVESNGAKKSSGGSFGIGKGAYFLMSPVRSLLVSTMVDDPQRDSWFQGVSRLCTHDLNGIHYYHMGFYCEDGKTPVSGDRIPEEFRRTEPGTSISLVGKYADLGTKSEIEESIERAVISNFWLAIFEKKLIVTIGRRKSVTDKTLEEKMNGLFGDVYERNNPYLFFKAYTSSQDNRQYFRFPLNNDPLLGNCELRLRIGEPGRLDKITYMRDLMMLIQTKSSPKQRHSGIYATFVCHGEPGNSNLELTEDESHTSWSVSGKSGESKKRAKAVLDRMEEFIIQSIESILGGPVDKIDVPIDKLTMDSEDMNSLEAQEGTDGNPFGAVKDGKSRKDGLDRISIPTDVKDKDNQSDRGNVISGPLITGAEGDGRPVSKGRLGRKKVKPKPHPKPGKGRTRIVVSANGEKFYRIVPADFAVAVHKEANRWVHALWVSPDETDYEPDGKAYLDLSVGSDSNSDSKVPIEKAAVAGKVVDVSGARIILDSMPDNDITIEITFADNLRHTINLN